MAKLKPPKRVPIAAREIWRQAELAEILGCDRRTVREMDKLELLPAPIKFGNTDVWRAPEIRAWLAAGTPQRSLWRWEPAALPTLSEAVRQKARELESLQDELTIAQMDIDEHEKKLGQLQQLAIENSKMILSKRGHNNAKNPG